MRYLLGPLVLVAGLMTVSVSSARAQIDSREGIALQNQIYQLRQDLRTIQDQASRSTAPRPLVSPSTSQQSGGGSELLTQLLSRVDTLEDQVRQLRGQVDESQNRLQRQNQDLSKRVDDLTFQLSTQRPPQPALSPPPAAVPPPDRTEATPGAPYQSPAPRAPAATATGPRTAETILREGNAALLRRDYAAAEAAAREVLTNRTSPRAYDAQFLLAQSLAGQRQYPQAAVAYDDVYNRAHTGSHAQEARLGLASSLTAINEKKAACDVLTRMPGEFSQIRPEVSAGMVATSQRAGCH